MENRVSRVAATRPFGRDTTFREDDGNLGTS